MDRRVVVTGLGAVTPLGNDLATSWQAALRGECGIDTVTQFRRLDSRLSDRR